MKAFFDSNIFLYHLTGNYSLASEYIEKVAREKLGMVKEEDIVFKERPKP